MDAANNTKMEATYAKILRQKTEAYIKYIGSDDFVNAVAKNVFNTACRYAEVGKNMAALNLNEILLETDPNVPAILCAGIIESLINVLKKEGFRVNHADGGMTNLYW